MGCLYKLTSPSGKSYVGISTRTINDRWRQHCANANKGRGEQIGRECLALYSAMRKYGADSFTREQLAESEDWLTLCRLEQEAIAANGTFAPGGYNLTQGGDGSVGANPTPESRQKMSEAQRKRLTNPDQKRIALEALAKAVKNRRAKWWARTPEEREAWGQSHGGKVKRGHSSAESKARTSAAARRTWSDPAYRERILKARTGKKHAPWTAERKQAAAALRLKEWADPVMRAKRLAGFARARRVA